MAISKEIERTPKHTLDTSEFQAYIVIAGVSTVLLAFNLYQHTELVSLFDFLGFLPFVPLMWAHYQMLKYYTRRTRAMDTALKVCDVSGAFIARLENEMEQLSTIELSYIRHIGEALEQRASPEDITALKREAQDTVLKMRERAQEIFSAACELELRQLRVSLDAYAPKPVQPAVP